MTGFWIRQLLLVVLAVVLPFAGAGYFDTQNEVERTLDSGIESAHQAADALNANLRLRARERIEVARDLAARLASGRDLASIREPAVASAVMSDLREMRGVTGFAWFVDSSGSILARDDAQRVPERPQSIRGRPLFIKTQLGYGLDTIWERDGSRFFVVAAPIEGPRGFAQGALVLGELIDADFLASLSARVGAEVSLIAGDAVIASTLGSDDASALSAALASDAAEHFGRWEPSSETGVPFLSVFVRVLLCQILLNL